MPASMWPSRRGHRRSGARLRARRRAGSGRAHRPCRSRRLERGGRPRHARLGPVGRLQAAARHSRRLASDRGSTPSRSPPSTLPIRACPMPSVPMLLSYDNTLAADEPATYIVENERLRQALVAAAVARPAVTLMGCVSRLTALPPTRGGVSIRLATATLRAPLLVGRRRSRLAPARRRRHQDPSLELPTNRHRHHRRP